MFTILEKQFTDHGIREIRLQEKTIKNLKFVWNYFRRNKIKFNTQIEFDGGLTSAKSKSANSCRLSEYVDFLDKYLEKMSFSTISFFVEEKEIHRIQLSGLQYSDYRSSPWIFINE